MGVLATYAYDCGHDAPSLFWPGLALARLGLRFAVVPFACVVIAALVVAWRRYPRQPWPRVITESLAAGIVYSTGAHLFLVKLPVPVPAETPFDQEPGDRQIYQQGFATGYRNGMMGFFITYCFYTEAETAGLEYGSDLGARVWYRFSGLPFPKRWAAAIEQREQASSQFGLYWERTPPPKLDEPEAMASVVAFIATNGWHMQTNVALDFVDRNGKRPISGLPWLAAQGREYPATTRDGVLYVRLHTWGLEDSGVAYNPQTNRFPPAVVGFKPLGDCWYTWLQSTEQSGHPRRYQGEPLSPETQRLLKTYESIYGELPRASSLP